MTCPAWMWSWEAPLGDAHARVEADGTVVWQVDERSRFAGASLGGEQSAASFLRDGPAFPDAPPPRDVVLAIMAHLRAAGFGA